MTNEFEDSSCEGVQKSSSFSDEEDETMIMEDFLNYTDDDSDISFETDNDNEPALKVGNTIANSEASTNSSRCRETRHPQEFSDSDTCTHSIKNSRDCKNRDVEKSNQVEKKHCKNTTTPPVIVFGF